jgi:polysaccharide chain length determinant protein (PEP-CTERM system associated)
MDEFIRQASAILIPMWRRRWIGMITAWVIAALGAGAVIVIQDKYEASARVFVDTQTVLKPLMVGLAFQPDVDQQVRMLARTLISRPNIERLIASPRIGLQGLSARDREKVIDRLLKDIKMAPSGDANLFAITYRDMNSDRAQRVVEDLVSLFMNSGLIDKQRDSEQARLFLDEQISLYVGKLSAAENQLKEFKVRNFGLTGTSNQDYFARMSSATTNVQHLEVELRAAEQARDALRKELSQERPSIPAEQQKTVSDVTLRLDAARKLLDELSHRYTDAHPDVLAVKRTIATLEAQKQRDSEQKVEDSDKRDAPTSPIFQKIRVSLAEAEAKVASLRGQLGAERSQLEQARAMAGKLPEVEAELAQLNRDYEVVRKNYEQLVARRESASLGVEIDRTTKVAEFRVIDPPRVSPSPVKPSRLMIALLSAVVGILAGAACAFALTRVFPTVGDTKQLKEISARPVLGSVALVIGPTLSQARSRGNRLFYTAAAAYVIANVAWAAVVMLKMLP